MSASQAKTDFKPNHLSNAFFSASLRDVDPEIASAIDQELGRQREEIELIQPTLETLRAEGLHLTGPLPADTAFTPRHLDTHDAVLAMYHDQGLPVLKYAGFGEAVNITLGLPFLRTSVDHGTAFELAGTGRAEPGSLIAATRMALTLSRTRATLPPL